MNWDMRIQGVKEGKMPSINKVTWKTFSPSCYFLQGEIVFKVFNQSNKENQVCEVANTHWSCLIEIELNEHVKLLPGSNFLVLPLLPVSYVFTVQSEWRHYWDWVMFHCTRSSKCHALAIQVQTEHAVLGKTVSWRGKGDLGGEMNS